MQMVHGIRRPLWLRDKECMYGSGSRPVFKPTHIPYTLSVTRHGIHHETIDGLFSAMKAYFLLPLETKMKVAFPLSYILFYF